MPEQKTGTIRDLADIVGAMKATSIGPPQVGTRYETTAQPTLLDILARVFSGSAGRPFSVAAQDPYGIDAWSRGAGSPPIMIGSIDVKPQTLAKGLRGDAGYVYHATSAERLNDIVESGRLKIHKPWEFTDQSTWPDGSTQRRAYFGASPEHLYQFAPEEGQPVIIRTKASPTIKRESTGDLFTTQPIPAHELEYLGSDGQWHQLKRNK